MNEVKGQGFFLQEEKYHSIAKQWFEEKEKQIYKEKLLIQNSKFEEYEVYQQILHEEFKILYYSGWNLYQNQEEEKAISKLNKVSKIFTQKIKIAKILFMILTCMKGLMSEKTNKKKESVGYFSKIKQFILE